MSDTLLRFERVSQLVGLRKTAIYDAIKHGRFPAQLTFGRSAFWVETEIQEWIDCLKAKRNGDGNGDCRWAV